MNASPSTMRARALAGVEAATGAIPSRPEGRSGPYVTSTGKRLHLRASNRNERRSDGWVVFWFGIQERFWQPDEFFMLACGLDFVLVVPTNDWMKDQQHFCLAKAGSLYPERQPHIYWRHSACELREGARGDVPFVRDVRNYMDAFHLLT